MLGADAPVLRRGDLWKIPCAYVRSAFTKKDRRPDLFFVRPSTPIFDQANGLKLAHAVPTFRLKLYTFYWKLVQPSPSMNFINEGDGQEKRSEMPWQMG